MSAQEEEDLIEAVLAVRKIIDFKTVSGLAYLGHAIHLARAFDTAQVKHIQNNDAELAASISLYGPTSLKDPSIPYPLKVTVAMALHLIEVGEFDMDLVDDVVKS